MTRRSTATQIVKQPSRLQELVKAYVLAHGGRSDDALMYELQLPTKLGGLGVHVVEDWIACRFVDTEHAIEHFGRGGLSNRLDPQSGKWNWGTGTSEPADVLFARWVQGVEGISATKEEVRT